MKPTTRHLALLTTFAFAALAAVPLAAQNRPPVTEKRGSSSSSSNSSQSGGSAGGGGFSSGGGRSFGSGGGQNFSRSFDSRGRSARPVIVTSRPLETKELAAAEEDLGIMTRLLEKELERVGGPGGQPDALGIALTQLNGRGPSAMLLEGYGAVFTLPTRLALSPTGQPRPAGTASTPPPNSPWEQTRREMFGEPGRLPGPPNGPGARPGGGFEMPMGFGPAEFDPKRVEDLKKGVLESLRHAANIRALKGDDFITVVVQSQAGAGPASGGEFFSETRTMTSTSVNGEPPRVETHVSRDGGPVGNGRPGTLSVRAKKVDCEDFAKGKLTLDQFAKKALANVQ